MEGLQTLAHEQDIELLAGSSLRDRIGWPPAEALEGCGPDIECLAALGRTAQANRVVVVRFSPATEGSGMLTQFLSIQVAGDGAVTKVEREVAGRADVMPWLREVFESLFGTSDEPELALEPLLELEAIEAPASQAAGPAWLNPWFFAGVGAAGAGVILAVVGAVFGASGDAKASTITGDLNLAAALEREAQVNQAYDIANGLFVAAGIVGAAGIGLTVAAFLQNSGHPAQQQVTVAASPSGAVLRWRW